VRAGRRRKDQNVKNRITTRGTAVVATAVVTALGLTGVAAGTGGVTAWGAESTVTRIGDLPPMASVSRSPVPAGELALRITKKHERQTAQDARVAGERAALGAHADRASRTRTYGGDPRGVAADIAASQYGWGADQFGCLDALWTRESGWDPHAQNPSSGAYGIPQALPGSKMSAFGSDWADDPATQIRWGLAYISDSYGTPCGAWSELRSQGWY
jgi:hypothetical protein